MNTNTDTNTNNTRNEFSELGPEGYFLKYTEPKDAQAEAECNWKWRLERSNVACVLNVEDWDELEQIATDPMPYIEGNKKLWDFLMNRCLVNWFDVFRSLVEVGVLSEDKFMARYDECMKAVKPNNELVAKWAKNAAKYEIESNDE